MMESRSQRLPIEAIRGKDIVFQAISWHAQDVAMDDGGEENSDEKYMIKVFGSDREGRTVSATILDFTPFFYVRVPDSWKEAHVRLFNKFLSEKMYNMAGSMLPLKLLKKKDFWGFSNFKDFNFVRLSFTSHRAMRRVMYLLANPVTINSLALSQYTFQQYESNIEPFLRFIHLADIRPTGWLQLPAGSYRSSTEFLASNCQIDVEVNWRKVKPFACEDTAPFLIASFDLECMSDTGDFPVPINKQYRKVAADLYEAYNDVIVKKYPMDHHHAAVLACLLKPFGAGNEADAARFGLALERINKAYAKNENYDRRAVMRGIRELAVDDVLNLLAGRMLKKQKREEIIDAINTILCKAALRLPEIRGDAIIQIGITFHHYGERECCRRLILSNGTCAAIDGSEVIECRDETELILRWRKVLVDTNPDVVTGYNIFGFDFEYIYQRAVDLGIQREFMQLGRFIDLPSKYEVKMLSSSALGDNELKFVDMQGRVLIDMMKVVQRDHKLDSYKLDAVASHFMKMNKNDVSPADIFRLYKGNDMDRKVIAEYCIQDCALCNHLIMKLEILANNMGMSNVCLVPLSYIFMRGQGIKIFSLVLKQCKDEGFVIPVKRPPRVKPGEEVEIDPNDDSYEGAIVLEPKEGIYINQPISVLDYASLYPSSMISENLSHDCIVTDEAYDNLPGVEYLTISYDLYEGVGDKKKKVGERACKFVQLPNGEKGIIPRILQKLLKARKTTRKKAEWQVARMKDGVVHTGFVDEDGDVVKVKLVGEHDGQVVEVARADVECVEDAYNDFQKAVLDGLQLAYKVTANSLYGQIGAKTSPIYLKDIAACTTATGRKMIMSAKKFIEDNYEGAEIIYGDSVTGYTPVTFLKQSTGLVLIDSIENVAAQYGGPWLPCRQKGKQDKEACNIIGISAWTASGWTPIKRVIRHVLGTCKKIIRVITSQGLVDVTDDHSLLRPDGSKVSPKDLEVGETLLHREPPMISHDGTPMLEMKSCILNDTTSHVHIAKVYALARSWGFSVQFHKLASGDIRLSFTHGSNLPLDNDIQDMYEIPYEGYVYDFTTENHQFQSGIGSIVVSNTDSIFCRFKTHDQMGNVLTGIEAIRKSRELGIDVSKRFKKIIKPPHDLEWEKLFDPFILLSKKRYVGNKYEHDDHKFKQASMGIVLKRRDNAPIVKKIYGGAIDKILNDKDIHKSIAFVRDELEKLVNGQAPLEDLIISKSLRANYADPTKIAHKVLAERIGDRDPGNRPQINDRIPFVYVEQPPADPTIPKCRQPKILQGERIEHPTYIRDHNLKPDYGFYITNQIMKPLLQLYAIVADQLGLRTHEEYEAMYAEYVKEYDSEAKAKDKMDAIKEKDVQKFLFDPYLERILPPKPVKPPSATALKKAAAAAKKAALTSVASTVDADVLEALTQPSVPSTSVTAATATEKPKKRTVARKKKLDEAIDATNPFDEAVTQMASDDATTIQPIPPLMCDDVPLVVDPLEALKKKRVVRKKAENEIADEQPKKRIVRKKTTAGGGDK